MYLTNDLRNRARSIHPKALDLLLAVCLGVQLSAGAAFAQSNKAMPSGTIVFDIPAQPLASALDAYGAMTGLDVYFDGALVQGHYSNVVRGSFTPSSALRILLDRTGLVAEAGRSDGMTILQGPKTALTPIPAAQDYEPYFAIVQAGIGKLFCRYPETWPGGESIVIRLWIGADGAIVRSEAPALGREPSRSRTFASELQNVRLDAAPPAGLPQPLTMVILPRHPDEVGCTPASVAGEAR